MHLFCEYRERVRNITVNGLDIWQEQLVPRQSNQRQIKGCLRRIDDADRDGNMGKAQGVSLTLPPGRPIVLGVPSSQADGPIAAS